MDSTTSGVSDISGWNPWIFLSNQNRLEIFTGLNSFGVFGPHALTNRGRMVSFSQDVLELHSSVDSPLILVRILRNDFTYENGIKILRPDLDIRLSSQFVSQSPPLIGRTSFVKIFEVLLSTLQGVVAELPNLRWRALDVFAVLQAHSLVLTQITSSLTMNRYCPGFGAMIAELEASIVPLQQVVENQFLLIHPTKEALFEFVISSIRYNLDKLSEWNSDEEFYFGKSEKFVGIDDIKDFLPNTSPPEDCAICKVTPLVESTNFGILSECSHVFCGGCLKEWFIKNPTCPLCRIESLWISRDDYLKLQDELHKSALE